MLAPNAQHDSNQLIFKTEFALGDQRCSLEIKQNQRGKRFLRFTVDAANALPRRRSEIVVSQEHTTTLMAELQRAAHWCDPRPRLADRIAKAREHAPRAYEPWTPEESRRLRELFEQGVQEADMANELQRQEGGIHAQLLKLGIIS